MAGSPLPILKDTTPQGLINWALSVAQWAATVQTELTALGAATGVSVTSSSTSTVSADPHWPFTILTADADTTLTDSEVGVVCAEFTTTATHTVTLPSPTDGAWFDIQMRAANASTGTFKISDNNANTLMSWTPGASLAHRWVRCEVQDNNGTLQWTIYIARTWTSDIPPAL